MKHGCPINGKDEIGRTPLHIATEEYSEYHCVQNSHDLAIICHLLRHGADVNASTYAGDTPLFQAIKHDSEFLVRLFMCHGANINYRRGENGANALHKAVLKGNRVIVEILLDAGAEVNSVINEGPYEGSTALHLAAGSANGSEDIVNLLIERGAMVNAKDHEGERLL